MKDHFKSEDDRKTRLFEAWNAHLDQFRKDHGTDEFQSIFEGMAQVIDVTTDRLSVCLEDGRTIKSLIITPQISQDTARRDNMYLRLGRINQRWWVLTVASIASIKGEHLAAFHMTINPIYMPAANNLPH